MATNQEFDTEGKVGAGHIVKVLLCGNTSGAVVWGGYVGVVDANVTVVRGSTCGFPEAVNKVKGKEAEGRFVAEGRSRKITLGRGDTTNPDLLGKETGNSGRVGGPTANFRLTCKGDML